MNHCNLFKILDQKFYCRPTLVVAKELLGKFLVCKSEGGEIALMINEVEAYDGFEDRASHAFRGKTSRNSIMFGAGGFWYLYLIYGMYWMLNIVTGLKDYPAAILIRGAGEFNGPGKLTKALGIDKFHNGKLASPKCGLWIEDRSNMEISSIREVSAYGEKSSGRSLSSGLTPPELRWKIKITPRIGVNYAGKIWAKKPYRFLLANCL